MSEVATVTHMTCEDFCKRYGSREIDRYIEDFYYEGFFYSEALFRDLEFLADKMHVVLTNKENWDYDKFFYEEWQSAETGLS